MSDENLREKLLNNTSYKNSDTTTYQKSDISYPENYTESNGNLLNKEVSDAAIKIEDHKFDDLTTMNIWGYGVGHFINDLAAAGWFNYLTIYLKSINPIDPKNAGFYAGLVLLSGQISDGVATPLVGYLSDKTNTRLGKRIPWYIVGLVLVCVCYIFIFQSCLFCEWFHCDAQGLKMFYYVLFPSLFNVGWAALQIAHMSLVPSLTSSRIRRDKLNGLRNTFTYGANFTVLLMALILFIAIDTPVTQFEVLSYLIVGLGLVASLFFLSQINEVKLSDACTNYTQKIKQYLRFVNTSNSQSDNEREKKLIENQQEVVVDIDLNATPLIRGDQSNDEEFEIDKKSHSIKKSVRHTAKGSHNHMMVEKEVHWSYWFKDVMFYQYGLVYMCVRIVCNVTSSLFNFYLVYVIHITNADLNRVTPVLLAIIPLILYSCSVFGSLFLNRLYKRIGRKKTYSLGALCIVGTSIAMIFLDESVNWLIYPVAMINGFGQSLALNTGIVLISEVIGLKGASGAFVFGAYSFCDKVANGIILFLILNSPYFEENDPTFIRWITVTIPAFSCIFAWIFIIKGRAKDYKVGDEQQGLEDEFAQ